jgi:hypothetical protein
MMQQMMFNEMMSSSRRSGGGSANSAARSSASKSSRTQPGGNANSKAAQSNGANGSQTGSLGTMQQQNKQTGSQTSKRDAANARAKEANREKERAKMKSHELKAALANRSTRAADNLAVGHLKTAHARLRSADADYQGHRVNAMRHIETAIHHLGSSSGLNAGMGMGNIGGANGGGGQMPQAESDQILQDAIHRLTQAQASLGTGTTAAAHHHNANTSITEAIHQLQTALKIR